MHCHVKHNVFTEMDPRLDPDSFLLERKNEPTSMPYNHSPKRAAVVPTMHIPSLMTER